jgi:hypothetical protein
LGDVWNEATVLLQLAESGQGFVEAALGGAHEALIEREVFRESDDQEFVGQGQAGGFYAAVAADAPVVFGDFVDQEFLGRGGGLVLGAEVGFESVEGGGVFTGYYEL